MKPLDVRLHETAAQATRLFVEAARSNHTRSDFLIHEDPAGDMTVASLVFTILHTGGLTREIERFSIVPRSYEVVESPETPQEAHQRAEEVEVEEVPMKMRVDDAPPLNFPDQTPCARCTKPRWKHQADETGGYAACREFIDKNQLALSLTNA
jgi:hypothetical protein